MVALSFPSLHGNRKELAAPRTVICAGSNRMHLFPYPGTSVRLVPNVAEDGPHNPSRRRSLLHMQDPSYRLRTPQPPTSRPAVIRRRETQEPQPAAMEKKLQADIAAWLRERRTSR